MFCEKVEEEMAKNGDYEEANFCHLIRQWREAEDIAGIPATERVKRVLNLRKWLLNGVDFGCFPPPGMYIKGIPKVTFESLLCNLEGHLYIYELVKEQTYCWRAYSSLIGESFFSEMTELDPSGKGVFTAAGVGQHMKRITQIHSMRLNPNRTFHMQTTESHVYPRTPALLCDRPSGKGSQREPPIYIDSITPLYVHSEIK
ncbi:uncharacterized protein LOC133188163 [Saccostrea echinata]|uniref:uncharacterized protein LOC133188163 n=1 Tax=Saccostrea echinata TaxID=191078 RepID=UPI002A8039DB|nr:uncharacterized protein LOC133188163 [Saccostrea echinata]